jgi:hypothetical protein
MKKLLLPLLFLIGLQTQAQINWCDSISYQILPNQILTVVDDASLLAPEAMLIVIPGITNQQGFLWTACDASACYGTFNNQFPQLSVLDTVKLCYEVFVFSTNNDSIYNLPMNCQHCDYVVYDTTTSTWVLVGNVIAPSWDCNNGICSDPGTGSGTYASLSACNTACVITPSWDCNTGICSDPGNGMGSFIDSLQCIINCSSTHIADFDNFNAVKVIKIVDVLGRKSKGLRNQPLFYIYNDGTVEKRIVIE